MSADRTWRSSHKMLFRSVRLPSNRPRRYAPDMLTQQSIVTQTLAPMPRRTSRRRWREKFREAFHGIKLGVRGHSSFSVHFFCAVVALAACVALDCRLVEWCLILLCIGGVFTAELV